MDDQPEPSLPVQGRLFRRPLEEAVAGDNDRWGRPHTAMGKVDGIHDGVAAWLDLDTRFGTVQNELDAAKQPEAGEESVEVRAQTAFGDIVIRRAATQRT